MKRQSVMAVVVGMVMALAACGSSSDGTEASSDGVEAVASPIAEFLGEEAFFDPEAGEEQFAEQQRQINEEVVECMAAEGWEYTPDDVNQTFFFESADEEGLEWGSREWTEKYGFGITTQMFPQEAVGPELVGYSDEAFGGGEDYVDPNAEYLETLSEADVEAYYEDLYGTDPGPEISDDMTDEEMDAAFREWEENRILDGCFPKAESEAFGGPDDFYSQFSEELDDMWEQMMNDPRIVEAEAEIAECVSDKGLTYTSMDDVYEDFYEQVQPLEEEVWGAMPELSDEEFEAMSETELEEFFNKPPELSPESKTKLGELQSEEISLAVAVDDCGGGQQAQEDLYNEVRVEYEQNFVDANRDRLEEYQTSSSG